MLAHEQGQALAEASPGRQLRDFDLPANNDVEVVVDRQLGRAQAGPGENRCDQVQGTSMAHPIPKR